MASLFSWSQLNWEHMGIIKCQLYKEDTSKRSLLTERVTKLREEIDQSTIDNMIDGMHMRLIKCIDVDGERINY